MYYNRMLETVFLADFIHRKSKPKDVAVWSVENRKSKALIILKLEQFKRNAFL